MKHNTQVAATGILAVMLFVSNVLLPAETIYASENADVVNITEYENSVSGNDPDYSDSANKPLSAYHYGPENPIVISSDEKMELKASVSAEDYILQWQMITAEKDVKPGNTYLLNETDDWNDFEVCGPDAPFLLQAGADAEYEGPNETESKSGEEWVVCADAVSLTLEYEPDPDLQFFLRLICEGKAGTSRSITTFPVICELAEQETPAEEIDFSADTIPEETEQEIVDEPTEQESEDQETEDQETEDQESEEQESEEQETEDQETELAKEAVDSESTDLAVTEIEATVTETDLLPFAETEEESDAQKNHDVPMDEEGNPLEITDEVWIAGFEKENPERIYTGKQIKQSLRIYHKGKLLKENTDYTLTYKNNVKAAAVYASKAPSVTIAMKGQYRGSKTLYYSIFPRPIDAAYYEQVVVCTAKMNIPAPTLHVNGINLTKGTDFTCDYSTLPRNYEKGSSYEIGEVYEYKINGCGNYTGSVKMHLAVVKNNAFHLGTATVKLDKGSYVFSGQPLTGEEVQVRSVVCGGKKVQAEYYEYFVRAEKPGKGILEIVPTQAGRKAGYRGSKTVSFTVKGDRPISSAALNASWESEVVYAAQNRNEKGAILQKGPELLSYPGVDEPLKEGVDYTVSYSANTKVGEAKVTFKGLGRYYGTLKKTFKITPNKNLFVNWLDCSDEDIPSAVYKKGGAVPNVRVTEKDDLSETVLKAGKDYRITVKNPSVIGKTVCEITGLGNYKGFYEKKTIEILAGNLALGSMRAKDRPYSTKTDAWKTTVSIYDVNGKKLSAGKDYKTKLTYSYEGMGERLPAVGDEIQVTAEGIGRYSGSFITGKYHIYQNSISSLYITIDAKDYTGNPVLLSEEDIHIYKNKTAWKQGTELAGAAYKIERYGNHTKVGTASVVLRGTGTLGGEKKVTFSIRKKKIPVVHVSKLVMEQSSLRLEVGESTALQTLVLPENASNKTIYYTSSDKKTAVVSPEGIITALRPGKITLYAKTQDGGLKKSCNLEVFSIPVEDFYLDEQELSGNAGESIRLQVVNPVPENATLSTLVWKSSHSFVASVDETGLVQFNRAGMAVIEAATEDGKVVRKCLVTVEGSDLDTDNAVTPNLYKNDDDDDDTASFNKAIAELNDDNNTLYIPDGTYLIDTTVGVHLKSNMNFIMSENAVLKAIPNAKSIYNVLYVREVENITISGGTIIGDKEEHEGTSGEWGMGVGIYDSRDIRIENVTVKKCFGDGIYLGTNHDTNPAAGCKNIVISGCKLDGNRRNDLSIVGADDVILHGCEFTGAGGTAPEYGIDIETNCNANPCERILISNSVIAGNANRGIGIETAAEDIRIDGCSIEGDILNLAGKNVQIAHTTIRGEIDARIGLFLEEGCVMNDGSEAEDELAAAFVAAEQEITPQKYKINADNPMKWDYITDDDSPNGKVLRLKRTGSGTKQTGYYLKLSDFAGDDLLKENQYYRIEYTVRGTGGWGYVSDQTGWYPCYPIADKFSTGMVSYRASAAEECRIIFYALDTKKGVYLDIDSIKIYEIK